MRKHGLRMAGLCLVAALSVMAFAAASAQAEPGSHWNINGSPLNNNTLLPEVEAELENNHGVLLTHILGNHVEILCTVMRFEGAVLKSEGSSLGKIIFRGCIFKVNGVTQAACEPHTGAEKGEILTKLLKDLIVLDEIGGKKEPVDLLVPEEGKTFVTIESSTECSVGGKIPVIGEFVIQDCEGAGRTEQPVHLGTELPSLTKLFVISETAEHKSTIEGSANFFLIGEHEGLNWSGTPA